MDRDRFEAGLNAVIAAHGTKIRAGIDAAACGTRRDWDRSHEADDAYLDAHEAFLVEVFAPPPAPPPPVPVVVGWEEEVHGRTRGRPVVWRRGVNIVMVSRGVAYTFTASADSLMSDTGNDIELRSTDFDPLDEGHSVGFRGITYSSAAPGPADLVKLAIEACRGVALRLHARVITPSAATRAWPESAPTFVDIVASEV